MKKMSVNAKRVSLSVVGIPFLISIASNVANLNWFGGIEEFFMYVFGMLAALHFIFIGPSIEELREYRQQKDLKTGKQRKIPFEVSPVTRNAVLALFSVPVNLAFANGLAGLGWFGDYESELMAASFAPFIVAFVYLKPRQRENEDV